MFFNFIKRTIDITACVSEDFAFAEKFYPIVPSSKFIPDWWKNTPKSKFNFEEFRNVRTVRSCPGIMGTFKNGYIQPLWSDLAFKHEDENYWRYQFADNLSEIDIHSSEQFVNFYKNYNFYKVNSPWLIRSSENIKFLMVDPFYLFDKPKPYIIPYGFLDGKVISSNFFFFVEKNLGVKEFLLKSGIPTIQIIPITEKTINFKTEVVSNREFKLLSNTYKVRKFSNVGIETRKILSNLKKKI